MRKIKLKWTSVGHLLQEAARKHQGKTLFIYENQKISYVEVDHRVNQVANALKDVGIAKGDKVGVMLPNGFEFPFTWLALAKIGAVMVPTNINYKEHDLAYILSDSDASAIVIHRDFLPLLESIRPKLPLLKKVIVLGDAPAGYYSFAAITASASDKFTIEDVGENDLLNIQYTSGTTGFPKGCMLTHRYWLLIGVTASEQYRALPDDVDLTAQPFYYMDPQWNTILCIMFGIPLVIMHRFSPSKFWQTVKMHNVTWFYVLGTMPFYLLKQEENPAIEQNHKLRFVLCSGIVPQFHAVFEKRWNVPWREVYGMTETGGDLFVPLEDDESVGSGAMGAVISTKEARVVDENGRDVPDGEIGELIIRGEPMMLGYWKKPEATAATILDGWLHTGDLVFKDKKGYFHWSGRLKDMIRRTGENISSVEVEGVLMEHEKIKLAACVPVPDELRGEEVKAYIMLQAGESRDTVSPETIVEFAKQKLAYFKVPRYLEYVTDLPRTPSERVEKHKLIAAKKDMRIDSYDAVDKKWR
jgi:crotonobetaine/carnitine-CoA ligase